MGVPKWHSHTNDAVKVGWNSWEIFTQNRDKVYALLTLLVSKILEVVLKDIKGIIIG